MIHPSPAATRRLLIPCFLELLLCLDLGDATIDKQVDTGDEAAVLGSEEQRGRRDFFWAAEPAERNCLRELSANGGSFPGGGDLAVHDGRIDRPRAERVDPDAPVLQLHRPRAREGADCRLAGAVGAVMRQPLHAGDRSGEDDAPAIAHQR